MIRVTNQHFGRRAAAVGAVVVLMLCTLLRPGTAQAPFETRGETFSIFGVSFPSVVDTFAVMQVQRYPNPNLGMQLHYRSPMAPRMPFDLFVYPVDEEKAESSEMVKAEFDEALESVRAYPRTNVEVTIEGTDSVAFRTDNGVLFEGWMAEIRMDGREGTQTSLLYVFEKNGWFMKYRISHRSSMRTALQDRVKAFLVGTLEDVQVKGM